MDNPLAGNFEGTVGGRAGLDSRLKLAGRGRVAQRGNKAAIETLTRCPTFMTLTPSELRRSHKLLIRKQSALSAPGRSSTQSYEKKLIYYVCTTLSDATIGLVYSHVNCSQTDHGVHT